MEFHVAKTGSDTAPGTAAQPFRTISQAAKLAMPGDTVKVHAGLYREWVNPVHSGAEEHRIVYETAGDGEVVISGAEPVADWVEDDGIWKCTVPNTLFKERNPFATELYGDWLFGQGDVYHLGEVYLNGQSLYEATALEKVKHPTESEQAVYPARSLRQWYAEAGSKETVIWANFGDADPRKELVEINVRPYCFWPEKTGRNYITVRGFTLKQAAPQWAPPTALQEGLIGPHWSKGWIIENNIISESKCTGISLGKEITTGNNEWSDLKFKAGTQREREVIFRASHANWQKEHIGGHVIRGNTIYNCEQAGIVGHLGGAFCEIYQNHIYDIFHKRQIGGAEIAGIKLHAAIDTEIHDNVIHGSLRGIWLDWQAQGTHVSRNVLYDNSSEDFFVEVSHGPYMVDHNIFLSPVNFRNMSQGGAFAHNLFTGKFIVCTELGRYTPYHFPHETAIAGVMNFMGGDDRFYNNIFIRDDDMNDEPVKMIFFGNAPKSGEEPIKIDGVPSTLICDLYPVGLRVYDSYPGADEQPWMQPMKLGDNSESRKLPVFIGGNVYLKGAIPSKHERSPKTTQDDLISILCENGQISIQYKDAGWLRGASPDRIHSGLLGNGFQAEMPFETANGTPYCFDYDFAGNPRPERNVTPGPFEPSEDGAITFIAVE